jgi:hypothetical protein
MGILLERRMNSDVLQANRIDNPGETIWAYASVYLRDECFRLVSAELAFSVEYVTLSVSYHGVISIIHPE